MFISSGKTSDTPKQCLNKYLGRCGPGQLTGRINWYIIYPGLPGTSPLLPHVVMNRHLPASVLTVLTQAHSQVPVYPPQLCMVSGQAPWGKAWSCPLPRASQWVCEVSGRTYPCALHRPANTQCSVLSTCHRSGGVQWNGVAVTCISLITLDLQHLFILSFCIWISSSMGCLFTSFAHFSIAFLSFSC